MNILFGIEEEQVEIEITEDDININIKETEKEIESVNNKLDIIFDVINNLTMVRNHVNKFGITKEFLHLVNTNNNLGSSLGIILPYYEDDNIDEIEIPNEVEVKELKISLENILTDAGKKVVEGFKWMLDKIVQFSKWIWNLIPFTKKKLEKVKEDTKPENIVKKVKEEIVEANKSLHDLDKAIDKVKEQQKENDKALDDAIETMSELIQEVTKEVKGNVTKPISNEILNGRFYTYKDANTLLQLRLDCLEDLVTYKLNYDTGEIDIKVDNLNKEGFKLGDGRALFFLNDGILKQKKITIEEYKKSNSSYPNMIEKKEGDSDWNINRLHTFDAELYNYVSGLEKLSEDIKKLINNCNSKITKKEPEIIKKAKDNLLLLLTISNSLLKVTNKMIDDFFIVANKQVVVITSHVKKTLMDKNGTMVF